ncbi:VOC family protein [Oscillatoria sp. CS-180]|uniref:VOC family protein n=1 Tax=Oscillatoria sp. CS-180 TaxID=3021720 RepID=UPI002330CD28|nr:VOC family protein [Oscillatoria sp. CS-180]MDB9526166.1 VOC family protein [Oscillatoria sp. CS-180]
MGIETGTGQVVWHDLLTPSVDKAREFYAQLLGWKYKVEHTDNFVWRPGEADYPLILANGEAHGGFVNTGWEISPCWAAYVNVEDVDATTAKAEILGATVYQRPFNTPGVGRSAVIRDPQGAIICLNSPTHNFPTPKGTFLWDELMTADLESARQFYSELFAWKSKDVDIKEMKYVLFVNANNINVAGAVQQTNAVDSAIWLPYLATNTIDLSTTKARVLGAVVTAEIDRPHAGRLSILMDPTKAMFGLMHP